MKKGGGNEAFLLFPTSQKAKKYLNSKIKNCPFFKLIGNFQAQLILSYYDI